MLLRLQRSTHPQLVLWYQPILYHLIEVALVNYQLYANIQIDSFSVTTPQPPSSVSSTATPCASCIISPTTYKPDVSHFGSSPNIGPHVEISHNALPSSTVLSLVSPTEKPLVEITPGGFQVSTATPEVETSTGLPLEYLKNVQAINNLQYHETSTQRPSYTETDQNSVEYNPYVNPLGQNVFFQVSEKTVL